MSAAVNARATVRIGRNRRATLATSPSNAARAWRRFRANQLALGALVGLALLVAFVAGAPLVSRYVTGVGPFDQDIANQFQPPSREHWLGTDEFGRDVLTRIAYGGRVSLGIGVLAMTVTLVLGTLVGALAAYLGRSVDQVLMRFVDVMLCIPGIYLLILVAAMYRLEPMTLALAIALLGWFGLARLIRSEILSLKERDFVEAARVVGAGDLAILFRHVVPNAVPLIAIWVTSEIPYFVVAEAGLSFLGLGVQPPTPSWGNMLTNSTVYLYRSVWLVVIPAAFIAFLVLSLSIVGYAARDALDPRLDQ
jgi:peptide/nickel transport system permease protein